MEDEARMELKKLSGEHSRLLWEIAKTGDLSTLSPENKKLAEIMLEHEEYHNQFEIADLLSEHEYDVDNEINPFLHVTIHAIAETQLENRDPIEVYQFYNAMRKKKASHHEAVHLICAVLAPFIFKTGRDKKMFDLEEYRSQLKSYKYMKPEKIFSSLEKQEEDSADD
ncbi:MAG: DUF1841 family protein [Thermodesulfobacteriota bacterium]|nr:DUF1841 family protein [Thermodesulfobacteriota bacterium]